ncbi:MAG: N-acetyltransferase [Ruminococcaceae bacterium]|nr:N-acetyltransferase [Oscillospiraceae bacterium]
MHIRHTRKEDLPRLLEIYAIARRFMAENGNPTQWKTNKPAPERVKQDIEENLNFVGVDDNDIIRFVFVFFTCPEPTYSYIENGAWLNDAPYGTIHRVATDGTVHGAMGEIVNFCRQTTENLRIDTHENNIPMQKALAKNGFKKCGTIYLEDGDSRIAFQRTEE